MSKITELQFSLLVQLVDEKDLSSLPTAQREYLLREPKTFWAMSKDQASNAITVLKTCSPKTPPVPPCENGTAQVAAATNDKEVPQGYYFIVDPTDGVEKFYRINKPQQGKWKGYTFVDVQASDYFYPVKNRQHREAILAEIAKDPITATNQYGIRLGRCGVCGRTLTNRDSRLAGIGPICGPRLRRYYAIALTPEDIALLMKEAEEVDD